MSSNPTPQTPATPSILSGQIRSALLVLAGIIATKSGIGSDWAPLIASILTMIAVAVWSAVEKHKAGQEIIKLAGQVADAKVAIGTALQLPAGATETILARTLANGPLAPAVSFIPMVNTSPTIKSVDTRPVMS
jgi:hypothetical protein